MRELFLKAMVLALVVVMLVQVYIGVVQIVSASKPNGMLRSLMLRGSRSSALNDEFPIGDTLRLVAESEIARSCRFRIYRGCSIVFEKSVCFAGSTAETNVLLNPPTFNVGGYIVVFDVYAYDNPIPGVRFSDSGILTFKLTNVETMLEVNATYDVAFRSLHIGSNLTDGEGYPVVGEAVYYKARLAEKQGPTDGWIPLGSSGTDNNGIAEMNLAFSMPNENYSIMAYHEGNMNFGESSDIVCVEIQSEDGAAHGLHLEASLGSSNIAPLTEGDGNLTIAVSSFTPYGLLPMNANASYSVESPLQGDCVAMFFFLDYMNETGVLGGIDFETYESPPCYIYQGILLWSPEVVGSHRIVVGVVNGSIFDVITAWVTGVGMRASGEVDIDIQPCPSNMIIQCAEAAYADVLPVTAVFSRPRPYQTESNGFYVSTTLSPKIVYNTVDYAIDEPVDSIPVKLYINGILKSENLTDEGGLAGFAPELSVSGHTAMNITVAVDDSVLLYERTSIKRVTNFTKVTLSDVEVNGSEVFKLNYVIGSNGMEGNEVYVGTENSIKAVVTLFGLPLWNVPVAFTVAENITRSGTSSGSASIPAGSDYLRVVKVYETLEPSQLAKIRFDNGQEVYVDGQVLVEIPSDPTPPTSLTVVKEPLIGDVDEDGDVDIFDIILVSNAYGSHPGSPNWNPHADLDDDGDVDIFDVAIVASHYGDNERVEADLEFVIGASLASESTTSNLGSATEVWNPTETGSYSVAVMVPSSFNVIVASWSDITQVNAYTSLIESFDVVKRQVDLSVTYTPEDPTLDDDVTLIASCVDAILGEPVGGVDVDFHAYDLYRATYISIGSSPTNSSGVATLLWHPNSFSQQHDIWPNFFLRVTCAEGEYTEMAEVEPVHIDTRYPTQLEFLGSEVMDVHVGFHYDLQWKLTSENETALAGKTVWVYPPTGTTAVFITTNSSGVVTWDWVPPHVGTFYWKAVLQDMYPLDWYYRTSNEVKVVAVADVLPVSILFDVQPREFKPGDNITLTATIFNASSSLPLTSGIQVSFYLVNATGEASHIGDGVTNSSGVATLAVPYHIGPNAYYAKVGVNQTIVSTSVMLTAATETELRLDAERDESGFNHTISGSLSSYGEPVDGKHVKIYVNGTLEADVTTWLYGSFNVTLNLQPENNEQTTYNVQAVFEGDDPSNATAYGFTPNGTRYAICSTIQYGYKPASNSTLLTVEPQTTQATQSTETPEQLQQEAEQSGWLKPPKPEFSLFYPWFRLHYTMVYDGTDVLDVGLSPLGADSITPYPPFDSWIIDAISEVIINPVAKAYLTGWIGAEITLFLAMHGGPVGFAIGLGATILIKEALFQLTSADTGGLKGSFVGALFSWAYGSIETMAQVANLGITALSEFFRISALDFWRLVYKFIYVFINMFYLIRIILKLVELGGW